MEPQIENRPTVDPPFPPSQQPSPLHKSPMLAAVLSVLPGLGNIYNGLYQRGLVFFSIWVAVFALAVNSHGGGDTAILVPAMTFFWFFSIFDAYRQATLINYAYQTGNPVASLDELPRVGSARSGGMLAGIALFVIGLYGFLEDRFDFDLSWLVDNWYLLVMAFGGWLIYQTIRQRREEEEESEPALDELDYTTDVAEPLEEE